jgi:hypothetical protein
VGVSKEEFEKTRSSGVACDVWHAGLSVKLRADWEVVKVHEMYRGNRAKMEQNPKMIRNLTSTKGEISFNNSSSFWCFWNAKIMTLLREEFREEKDRNNELIAQIWKEMDVYSAKEKEKMEGKGNNNNNNNN